MNGPGGGRVGGGCPWRSFQPSGLLSGGAGLVAGPAGCLVVVLRTVRERVGMSGFYVRR